MFWGRDQKPVKRPNLILDLGTGSLKAMLVFEEDKELHVSGKSYIKAKTGSLRGGLIQDLPLVTLAASRAIEEVFAQSGTQVDSVIFGVGGQLVESVTTTVHYDRINPEQPLEAAELKNIIYRIIERSNEKLRSALKDKFNDEHPDIELIHAAVVDVQLDGYTIANPVGFQGKRLSLTIFNAYIPLVYASVLQNLAKNLGLSIKSIAAQPYGVSKIFLGLPDIAKTENAVFIDVGHSATDLIVVKNGQVEGFQSFIFGGEDITRAIMRELKLSHEKAESLKKDYARGQLSAKQSQQVADAIRESVTIWRDGIRLSLAEFSDLKMIGSQIYLTGGGAALPDMKKSLHTKAWWADLPFVKRPTIAIIHPDQIENVVDEIGLDWDESDIPPLGLAKLTIDAYAPDDSVTTTLQSITRSLKDL